jgi:HAE1 family hydrophobic/amphiphilic exporter-1
VADVKDSLQSEDMKLAYWARDGVKPGSVGVVLAVTKASGANNVEVAQGVLKLLPSILATLPASIQIIPIYNRSASITNSVKDVNNTLVIAFVLVVIVVFLFLGRVRDTLIPAVALPMSLLMTFIAMHALDYTVDNLSLMAITLSVGFLIDDAIVFLENMVRRMEAGETVWVAVFAGAQEISFTILAMTLSLGSVFIPIVGMGGLMGRVFREFGVTIIVAVISSGIVSLTLTPMMCSRVLKEYNKAGRTWIERTTHRIEERVLSLYSPTLTFALKHWYFSVLAYLLCFFGVFWFYGLLPKTFLPPGDSGMIFGVWLSNTDTSPTEMQKQQAQIIDKIRANPAVLGFVTVSGFSSRINSNQGITFIALDDASKRPPIQQVNQQIVGELMKIPGVLPLLQPRAGLQISTGAVSNLQGGNSFLLSGLDKELVYSSAVKLMMAMRQSGLFQAVNSDYFPDNRQLEMTVNRNQASTYGVKATSLADTLGNAYSQNYSYLIKSDYQQYWVIVEAAPQFRARASNTSEVYFDSLVNQDPLFSQAASSGEAEAGGLVPLSTVASQNITLSPLSVNHVNGFTSVTIFFGVAPGTDLGKATTFVEQYTAKNISPAITTGFQGDALVFKQTAVSMVYMGFVALFVMYIILGILYESYVHPFTVLLSIPPAIVGAFITLWLFHSELSLYSLIGVFMLAGLVKKNAIMMIDFAVQRQSEGRTPMDAVHEACMERFRPIIMTTCAAFFGALPLAVGFGADAASRKPLGLTICGGLVVSQLLTLYVTPVTYLGFEWVQTHMLDRMPFLARRKHGQGETTPPAPANAQPSPSAPAIP